MKTASAKAKGRELQKFVRDLLLSLSPNLTEDDVRSTAMGQGGEDVQLSSAARQEFPFSIECKSRAAFAFYKDYEQAKKNCPQGAEPLLVCKGNRKKPVVIVDAEWFFTRMKQ
jgi:hypothetical protein